MEIYINILNTFRPVHLQAVSEETSGPGPTDSEMADQGSTGDDLPFPV